MAYGVTADAQNYIPTQLWASATTSQPSTATVGDWFTQYSNWVDNTLRDRYVVPITDTEDVSTLTKIVSMLVASDIWQVVGGHGGELPSNAKELKEKAFMLLGYDKKTGASAIVLPGSTEATDSGSAQTGALMSGFPDPTFTRAIVW